MPYSLPHALSDICRYILVTQPMSILDIGAGFGSFGVLARLYTDICYNRYHRLQWKTKIIGIEIHKPYLNPLHDYIYDSMIFADAVRVLESFQKKNEKFDLILCCDAIEHFDKERGLWLLELINSTSKTSVITTPLKFFPQTGFLNNPYETHRSHWTKEDFIGYRVKILCQNKILAVRDVPIDANKMSFYKFHLDEFELIENRVNS